MAICIGQATVTIDLWMNSDGHHINILSTQVRYSGAGCSRDSNGICYWIRIFVDSNQLSGYNV